MPVIGNTAPCCPPQPVSPDTLLPRLAQIAKRLDEIHAINEGTLARLASISPVGSARSDSKNPETVFSLIEFLDCQSSLILSDALNFEHLVGTL